MPQPVQKEKAIVVESEDGVMRGSLKVVRELDDDSAEESEEYYYETEAEPEECCDESAEKSDASEEYVVLNNLNGMGEHDMPNNRESALQQDRVPQVPQAAPLASLQAPPQSSVDIDPLIAFENQIKLFNASTAHLSSMRDTSSGESIQALCITSWTEMLELLKEEVQSGNAKAAKDAATIAKTFLENIHSLAFKQKMTTPQFRSYELQFRHDLSAIDFFDAEINNLSRAHEFKRKLIFALACTAYVAIGLLAISVGLINGAVNITAAVGTLAFYCAKGNYGQGFQRLVTKLTAPTLLIAGVGGYVAWCNLFEKRPMFAAYDQAREDTKALITKNASIITKAIG